MRYPESLNVSIIRLAHDRHGVPGPPANGGYIRPARPALIRYRAISGGVSAG
jgi:hypothetical protein